jgi:hypothetical protein
LKWFFQNKKNRNWIWKEKKFKGCCDIFHGQVENWCSWVRNEGGEKSNWHQTVHHYNTLTIEEGRECLETSNDATKQFLHHRSQPHMSPEGDGVADVLTCIMHVSVAFCFLCVKR